MKVLIKDVKIGAKYEGKIYDFFILGQLKSGLQIRIFDLFGYDLRQYINLKVNCSIQAIIIENINNNININNPFVKGIFVQQISIPLSWIKINSEIRDSNWYGVQNNDGIYFINPSDLQNLNLKKGDIVEFNVGRFDLLAWHPINEKL